MDLASLLPGDPRVALENAEEKFIRRRLSPRELRRMATSVREGAERMEEAAARVRHRADVYDDIAEERERA